MSPTTSNKYQQRTPDIAYSSRIPRVPDTRFDHHAPYRCDTASNIACGVRGCRPDAWRRSAEAPGDDRHTVHDQPASGYSQRGDPGHAGRGRDRYHRPYAVPYRDRAPMHGPEARRLPWHRCTQLHESRRTGRARHRGAHDQGLWRHGSSGVCGGADVDRRAWLREDGPGNTRRELGALRVASAHRSHDRVARLRRDRDGGRSTRFGHGHEGAGLEPQPEDVSRCSVRRARPATRPE